MGNWREFQEMNRDAMNAAAFRRAERDYLTPPEPPEEDYFEDDPEDIDEERLIRKFEREREETKP